MVTIIRDTSEEYSVSFGIESIVNIANEIKTVPDEYINVSGNGITEAGLAYLAPLIIGEPEMKFENGMPKHVII